MKELIEKLLEQERESFKKIRASCTLDEDGMTTDRTETIMVAESSGKIKAYRELLFQISMNSKL